jgi:AraC-like DNA-binding protein
VQVADDAPVRVDQTDAEVADAALPLMRLLDSPASIPLLQGQLVREMHYWLLAGRHGTAIRALGWPDSHVQRVARAVAVLRAEFSRPLPVERLAAVAGMNPSAFFQHFRAVTSFSPRQFQKQLPLIEARRLMLSQGLSASSAAFAVGYESVQQFTREYGRMFGLPPVRDTQAAKRLTESAAEDDNQASALASPVGQVMAAYRLHIAGPAGAGVCAEWPPSGRPLPASFRPSRGLPPPVCRQSSPRWRACPAPP